MTTKTFNDRIAEFAPVEDAKRIERMLTQYTKSNNGAVAAMNDLQRFGYKFNDTTVNNIKTLIILSKERATGVTVDTIEEVEALPNPEEQEFPIKEKVKGLISRPTLKKEWFATKKILVIDIETIPMLTEQYQIYNSFGSPKAVVSEGRMLCWAAKWVGDPTNTRYFVDLRRGERKMIESLWLLLDEADYVVTWNGNRFDIPKVNGYFAKVGLALPSPYKSLDLMVAAKKFGFESKSLYFVNRMLGTQGKKVEGAGAAGWRECLGIHTAVGGDWETQLDHARRMIAPYDLENETPEQKKAWKEMKFYNVGDIEATEADFFILAPHLKGVTLFDTGCIFCGSHDYTAAGVHRTSSSEWQVVRCSECSTVYRVGSATRRQTITNARPL